MKTATPTLSPAATGGNSASEQRGTLLMTAGGVLLGSIGIFVTEAHQDAVTTVLFRCLFGGLALLLWGAASGRLAELRLSGRALLAAVLAGVLMVSNWALFFAAIPMTSIGVATVVFHLQPFWVLLLGAWLLREHLSSTRALACGVALLGLALATGLFDQPAAQVLSSSYLTGLLLCLFGSLCYAGVPLIAKLAPGVSAFALAWWQCAVGVLLSCWWPLWHGWPQAGAAWGWLVGLGSLHTGLAYVLLYAGMSRLPTSRIAVLQFIYPATAIVIDWLAYGHALGPLQFGGLILLGGALWTVRRSA
ncbi:DMT family transporter [Vogesella sp. LIG4]|uniref:DMT family transporter n=1 Tax=Vogesella sp. LIG4 TaxID=1192162 RepID=UPI00081FA3E6|nr:DMT family transporter [Vogesella sp. LIG4]SCK05500.1 EamA domain-containing membrane protein RarD [Vogesella sp. LIG4]